MGRVSKNEKILMNILKRRYNIIPISQYRHPSIPMLSFDVMFEYDKKQWILEYDGMQHFHQGVRYVRTKKKFQSLNLRDRIKTFVALSNRMNMIRIDHTITCEENFIRILDNVFYINQSIGSEKTFLYVSNLNVYDNLIQSSFEIGESIKYFKNTQHQK